MRKVYLLHSIVFIILLSLFFSLISFELEAQEKGQIFQSRGVPANPNAQTEYVQPDGTLLTIRMNGDAVVNWATTIDGYTLLLNEENGFEYAMLSKNDDLISSGILAQDPEVRNIEASTFLKGVKPGVLYSKTQVKTKKENHIFFVNKAKSSKAFPTTGTMNYIVILANFNNTSTSYSQANFDNYMNQVNFNGTGSFKDYYLENSYGQLILNTLVTVWVTLPNTHDYYGPQSNWGEFAYNSVQAADPYVNYANYDNDGDGTVDGIGIIHQGRGQEESGSTLDIWSHSWDLASAGYSSAQRTFDGVYAYSYTTQPELANSLGAMGNIGVMCHEFGHNLGAPDFYDTDYGTGGSYDGTGSWDCMAGGSWNNSGITPAHHNGFTKWFYYGWLTPVTISSSATISMTNVEQNQVMYLYTTTTTNEYYLLENRQQIGFDAALPGHGLIIYHADQDYITTHDGPNDINATSHQGLYPKAAGGTINASSCPFPGTSGNTSFTDLTTPNSQSWAGANTNKPVTNITEISQTITFDFMGGAGGNPVNLAATAISTSQIDLSWLLNSNNDNVLIAWSSTGTFGTPVNGTVYSSGQTIPGGGTVLQFGSGTFFNHTLLNSNTTYYYKAWSYLPGNTYSPGTAVSATTLCDAISSFPWTEDFENGGSSPSCWSNQHSVGTLDWSYQNGGQSGNPASAHGGSYNAFLYNASTSPFVTRLVTPELDLSGLTNPELKFWHTQALWVSDQDELRVYYKTSLGGAWNLLQAWTTSFTSWTEETIPLPSPNSSYYIAFEGTAKYGYGVCIDDVSVDGVLPGAGLWTGVSSSNWHTPGNWGNLNVPTAGVDVVIPASSPNWPIYSGDFELGVDCHNLVLDGASELSVFGDLTISAGNSLSCNADATIFVVGDWVNYGTFNSGIGTVILNGNANTNIEAVGSVQGSLQTTFVGGNGSAGNMFDIVAINDVTITSFDASLASGTGNLDIYYKTGTYVGSETNSSAWNLVGSMSILSAGNNVPTAIPIPVLVTIPAGQTYAFYIHDDNGNAYTTGSSVGNVYASDANIQFLEGCGKNNPLFTGATYQPRVFNGNIHYNYSSGSGTVTLNKLVIGKNNAEIINNVNLNVNESLTITPDARLTNSTGNMINVTGNMILEGTSSGKASYIDNGTTNVSGTTIMESYYTDDRWHFISSPVTNAVSNIFLDIYLKHWNEADSTWTYISSTDSLLRVGKGYEIWPTIGNPTIQYFGGILNTGNFSPQLTATDQGGTPGIGDGEGWNFVGNPYPSAINWGTGNSPVVGYVKTNLDNTIYCWNGTQYATYNPTGNGGNGTATNGGSQYIQSLQSFFVKALDFNPVLTIPNGARIHSAQANLKSTTNSQMIRLLVSGNTGSDEIVIEVNENSTTGFDSEFDAYKLWGYDNVPQFYFKINELNLSVNVVPAIFSNDVFNLGFRTGMENVFTIEATEIENFNGFEFILLEDLKTNTIVNLKENPVYEFSGFPIDNSNRFLLKFSDDFLGMESFNENLINVYAYQNTIYVQFLSEFKPGNLIVYDLLGQEVHRQKINHVKYETISISAETGYYLVAFETNNNFITKKVFIK